MRTVPPAAVLAACLVLLPGTRAEDPPQTAGKAITLRLRTRVETE